ncbi:MAG: hypothetical protein V1873_05795 [Verrucomicrobiota bacterium]
MKRCSMTSLLRRLARRVPLAACVVALGAFALAGCEGENDDFDHEPPAGKGTLYIDNHTADDLNVYIDGIKVSSVGDGDTRFYDLDPGKHRVVLDDKHSDRNFRDDEDVVEGQRTIMEVSIDLDDIYAYDVFVYFD